MNKSKIIKGVVGGGKFTVTAPIIKEDYGLYLKIEGIELPETYEVDFSNDEHSGSSVTMIGNSDGVLIPSQFIKSGKDVFAFLYHVGEDYGRTVFKFRIPNKLRPDRTDEEPTPEQASTIDQAIAALNTAAAKTAQDVIDADASAQSAKEDADRAESAKDTAGEYANDAESHATSASQSASQASASARASAQSASASAQIKTDVEGMVDDAQASADASERSASNAHTYATSAERSSVNASASASSAQGYASQAQTSANTASAKASEASASAQSASTKASESAQSASQALAYKTDAESAKTASQAAQGLAESARDEAVAAKTGAESARDKAQDIADGISGKVEQIDQNTADIASLEEDRYKPYVVDSASGSIASFPDGADDIPLKSLVVDIDPVQDLHGQDAPYPAGGGKNLFNGADVSTNYPNNWGVEFSDGTLTITHKTSYSTGAPTLPLNLSVGTYVLSFKSATKQSSISLYVDGAYNKILNSGTTFSIESDKSYEMLFAADQGTPNIITNLQIESGSTATDYAPYENICPISGWTEVDVEQSGVNVWDEQWEVGGISSVNGANTNVVNAIRTKGFTRIKPLTSYYNYFGNTSGGVNFQARFYDADKNYIGYISASGTGIGKNAAFVTPSNAHYLRFQVQADYGTTYNHDISVNYPSTDHEYHPYTGRSITIDLGQTVYGGKLDVLSGVLTVDRGVLDMSTASWIFKTDTKRATTNDISNLVKIPSDVTLVSGSIAESYEELTAKKTLADGKYAILSTGTVILYYDGTAPSGKLVYPLAMPLTIQLTPKQVNSLLGVNNIWADTGDSSVEYRANTRLYIEKLTQPEEDDMIADSAISEGQFFMVGNTLYRALANIASGAIITVGTNAQRVSLSDALNLVNA